MRGADALPPFRQHQQDRFINVVVHQHYSSFCGLDQVRCESISVEDLAFVEDALYRGESGAHEEGDFLFGVADTLLQSFKSLVDGISAKDIIFEDGIGPLTETSGIS